MKKVVACTAVVMVGMGEVDSPKHRKEVERQELRVPWRREGVEEDPPVSGLTKSRRCH